MKQLELKSEDIGTAKRVKTPKKQEISESRVKKAIHSTIQWVDNNVLPIVSLIALAGLAVKGLSVYLPMLSDKAQTVASIAVVGYLVVKTKSQD
jgi:hypothetical protein